jgi:diacylglycerol kinase family enzyme
MKICVIYNPTSGRFNLNLLKKNLSIIFSQANIDYMRTSSPKHATEIVSQFHTKDYDRIICVGGDGTINEILNGFRDDLLVPLAIIPFGTANILSYELGINSNFTKSLVALQKGEDKEFYYGFAGNKKFFSMLGVGFDAYIVSKINLVLKKKYGKVIYFFETLKAFFTYKYPPFKVNINNTNYTIYSLIIANSKYYAGRYVISKKIDITDDKLHSILFLKKGIFQFFIYFFLIIIGKIHFSKNFKILESKKIYIDGKNIFMHVDGDLINFENLIRISNNTVRIKSLV